MKRLCTILVAVLLVCPVAAAQQRPESAAPQTVAAKTAGLKSFTGYFNFYWDEKAGKIWLEIDKWGDEFLYVNSLPAGVGSNDIGHDSGQLGGARIVRFERSGPKVLLTQSNYEYRAITDNPDERRAVRDSFAESVLFFGFAQIKKFEENPKELNLTRPVDPPDGAPIGSDCDIDRP